VHRRRRYSKRPQNKRLSLEGLPLWAGHTRRATLTLVDSEKVSDDIVFSCPLSTAQLKACHPVQNLGAALTYTRRYLYTMAFEIVEADLVNGAPTEKPMSPKERLEQLWRQAGVTQPLEDYLKQCAKTSGLSGDALYTKAFENTRHYCQTKGVGARC